jgi:adenosylcobinamide-GDP ribazoletransferase
MRTFLVAVQLRTRMPVQLRRAPSEAELARAAAWFPLVGAGVGALAAAAWWLATAMRLGTLAPWAALGAAVAATGAFHEDGLADCADGLFGGHDPHRRLAIMRDSRLGTYGVLALVLTLGAQAAAVGSMPPSLAPRAIVAAHALGRAAALPLTLLPYARAEGGLGKPLAQKVPAAALALGVATGLSALVLLPWATALAAAAAAALIAALLAWRFRRDLGGVTGDALGAVVKLVEVATYAVVVAQP